MSSDIQSAKTSVYTQSLFDEKLPGEFDTRSLTTPHPQAAFARHETFHPRYANTWYFTSTCFRRPELSCESLLSALTEYVRQQFPQQNVAESSFQKDIFCLLHMYTSPKTRVTAIEDLVDSPFATLGLIESEGDGKYYSFHVGYKSTLPAEIIVTACLEFADSVGKPERTISLSHF